MNELTIATQKEFDSIPEGFSGIVYIKNAKEKIYVKENRYKFRVVAWGNSSVVARENSSVVAWGNSSVAARENSSVVARENSSVVAWGNSSVEAWGNSSVAARENSSVEARENSSVEAWGNSSVEAWENSSVEARENSSVVAWGNSSVEARENSSVEAWENSSVEAWGNSSVAARENSSVVAWGNSSVEAWGNSSVEAWENSSVEAWGNVQVVDRLRNGTVEINGNARIVYMPKTIEDFCDFYEIKVAKGKGIFYKAVNPDLSSGYKSSYRYEIGKIAKEECDPDITEDCSNGLHIAFMDWALRYGKSIFSDDFKIIECEVLLKDIVLPNNSDGKVRTSKLKVLREVPLEECGLYGKMLAARRSSK